MNPSYFILALFLTYCGAAHAATQVVPVAQRMLNESGAQGARVRSFLVVPSVDVDETYNDNIYATSTNTKSDFITTARPKISARSDWNRHALNALASAEFNRFAHHDKENTGNYTAALDGRVDILRETSLGGGISWVRSHEDRGDPNSASTSLKPTQFDITTGKLGLYRGLGKLNARLDGQVVNLDYRNGTSTTGGLISNNLRDRTEYAQSLRLGYAAYPGYEAYVRGTLDNRIYKNKAPANRSSRGDTVVAGLGMDLSGKTKADAFAGYGHRNYSGAFRDVSEPVYGLNATWNATDLTTVLAHVTRTIEETTLGTSSAYVLSSYGADIQHAFTRRMLGTAGLEYATYNYKGTAAGQRNDAFWTAKTGGKYLLNRMLSLGASYEYRNRESNVIGGDYNRNMAMLRLTGVF